MAAEGAAAFQSLDAAVFSPFEAAQEASSEIIDLILTEGGQRLYESYIEKKSFAFASQVLSRQLVAELRLCYVRHDLGEPRGEAAGVASSSAGAAAAAAIASPAAAAATAVAAAASSSGPWVPAVSAQLWPPAVAAQLGAPVRVATAEPYYRGKEVLLEEPEELGPLEGWSLEPEPPRSRCDTWARSCVPIKRKLVQPKQTPPPKIKSTSKLSSRGTSRSPSRQGAGGMSGGLGNTADTLGSQLREKPAPQLVPLVDEREEDEEEAEMREKKDREARRRREEEARVQQKAKAEAEEAASLAQVRDQMKNKPFTYDSNGDILWVQPLDAKKLPNPTPAPTFAAKTDPSSLPPEQQHDAPPRKAPRGKRKGKKAPEYTDSFQRMETQQPSMVESMRLQEGVAISERGRSKQGGQRTLRPGEPMTRKEYQEKISGETEKGAHRKGPGSSTQASSAQDLAAEAMVAAAVAAAAAASEQDAVPKPPPMRMVRAPDAGSELVPRAPTTPRVPTASFRRLQMKPNALGHSLGPRERAPAGTNSRFPGCAAPPPLGATMGHGLAAGSQKPEEFYFPGSGGGVSGSLGAGGSAQEGSYETYPSASVASVSPSRHGHIVSANPDLARKLFPR